VRRLANSRRRGDAAAAASCAGADEEFQNGLRDSRPHGRHLTFPTEKLARPGELAIVEKILPEGIELEHDGTYDASSATRPRNLRAAAKVEVTLRGSRCVRAGSSRSEGLGDQWIAYTCSARQPSRR